MTQSSTPTIALDSLRSSGPLAPPDLPVAERRARGCALRAQTSRRSHAGWTPPADRPDPIALLESEAVNRVPELVPIRYGRMLASPFAFLRGAAILMAADLATTPSTGIVVQLCGDAHLANFGLYASPERRLLFDVNDFDQTLPGPWEWDVKRLAASIMVAGRTYGIGEAAARDAVHEAIHSYRARMAAFASMAEQAVWYARVRAATFVADQSRTLIKRRAHAAIAKPRQHDHHQSLAKLTDVRKAGVKSWRLRYPLREIDDVSSSERERAKDGYILSASLEELCCGMMAVQPRRWSCGGGSRRGATPSATRAGTSSTPPIGQPKSCTS